MQRFHKSTEYVMLCNQVQLQIIFIQIISIKVNKMYHQQSPRLPKYKHLALERQEMIKRTKFIILSNQYYFRNEIILNNHKKLLILHGQLIYKNGEIVPLSISHMSLLKKYINTNSQKVSSSIMFIINEKTLALQFTYKLMGVKNIEEGQKIHDKIQILIRDKKKSIISFLSMIGLPSPSQSKLNRKILCEKRKLKERILDIFNSKIIQNGGSTNLDYTIKGQQNGIIQIVKNGKYIMVQDHQIKKQRQKNKKYEGGYFDIEQIPFNIMNTQRKIIVSKRIVEKSLRGNRRHQNSSRYNLKIEHELKIIRQIQNKSFLIRYYLDGKKVYMDRIDHSLHEYVYYLGDSLAMADKIQISKQIIEAVITLHESNIVHRDIKASNFLLKDQNNKYQLKIIDFAESYCSQLDISSGDYACSHPFSPLECSQKKSIVNGVPQQGICNKQIDYWSVGIAIYQVFFRKLPISFSRAFLYDITTSWKNELLLAVDQREKQGSLVIQDIVTIICIKMMRYKQQQRMNLMLAKLLISQLENYYSNLLRILTQNC